MKLLTCSSQQLGAKQSRKFQRWSTQFKARLEHEDIEMPKEEHGETVEEQNETEQNMEESGNDVTDLEEDEDSSRSLFKRTEQMWKWHRPSRVVRRSDRPNKGIKPAWFMVCK